jgi:hypothetical protein
MTKPMNGGPTFTCAFYENKVTTLDCHIANGNRRTQAATKITQHVALGAFAGVENNMWHPRYVCF